MDDRANAVIIGAGIVGCGMADYLTRLGWTDVVVLEKGPLCETGGSTSPAPGLVFQTNSPRAITELATYSLKCFSELDLDGDPCFYPVGSIEDASTPERREDLKRKHGPARSWSVDSHLIGPEQAGAHIPLNNTDLVYGGPNVPGAGFAKVARIAEAMARQAQERGARSHGHTEVTGIDVVSRQVRAVRPQTGSLKEVDRAR